MSKRKPSVAARAKARLDAAPAAKAAPSLAPKAAPKGAPNFEELRDARAAEGRPAPSGKLFRVRATKTGYIHDARQREGDVFDVTKQEFSEKWMEVVDGSTPPKTTSNKAALKRHHDETLAARVGNAKEAKTASAKSSGDEDVLSR